MTAYNPINGHWSASNYDLNTTILRKEWGYKGIVMTDWWARMNDVIHGGPSDTRNTNSMVRAQNDLYMVVINYGAAINASEDNTIESLENGTLTRGELQRSAMNICEFIMNAPVFFREKEAETVKMFSANPTITPSEVQVLSENNQVKPDPTGSTFIKVNQAGEYRLTVNVMSPDHKWAQSACNVSLNNELMLTVQTNGTDGKWITQKLIKIELEEGYYEMKLDFIKPGLQVGWIELKQE